MKLDLMNAQDRTKRGSASQIEGPLVHSEDYRNSHTGERAAACGVALRRKRQSVRVADSGLFR